MRRSDFIKCVSSYPEIFAIKPMLRYRQDHGGYLETLTPSSCWNQAQRVNTFTHGPSVSYNARTCKERCSFSPAALMSLWFNTSNNVCTPTRLQTEPRISCPQSCVSLAHIACNSTLLEQKLQILNYATGRQLSFYQRVLFVPQLISPSIWFIRKQMVQLILNGI